MSGLMKMLGALLFACSVSFAQEASVGVMVPFTLTGGILRTDGLGNRDANGGDFSPAFRGLFYPSWKLGPTWFTYTAIQVSHSPSSYYGSSDATSSVQLRVLQGFLGGTWTMHGITAAVKAGQLASAFGSFPLRYDDTVNPLLDQPLSYRSVLRIRPDQLPCGVTDLARQWRNYSGGALPAVRLRCGGDRTSSQGMIPITLYGLPGVEAGFSSHKVDARIQLTNSSPANPQNLLSENQYLQWAAGAGYSIRQGFRVGFSAFRGPYLNNSVTERLPAGEDVRSYPATGIGAEVQWARGRWSLESEWQRFQFNYPRFIVSPAVSFGYAEAKVILNPRFFAAARLGYEKYHPVEDERIRSDEFLAGRRAYELALGYRPNRWQLIKVGYQRLRIEGDSGVYDNIVGVQLVTSIQSIAKSFR